MKKMKSWKPIAFAVMFVLMLAGTMKLIASADAGQGFSEDAIKVDYINETITVTVVEREGENGYPTVDLDQLDTVVYYTDKYNKDVSKWNACEVREREYEQVNADGNKTTRKEVVAVFDISWVNDSKTVRLYLCGNKKNTKVVAVDLTWEENFKVDFTGTLLATDITEAKYWKDVYASYPNFSEDTGYFIFTLEENGRDNYYFDLDNILWRKGSDGVWREFKELDLKEMNIRGIKLEFRIKASNGEIKDANGEAVAAARASSIAKYSVSKLSSAPQIVVNPDTMSVGIKNGMEFSFDKEEWIMVPEYNKKFGDVEYLVAEIDREHAIEKIYTSERITDLLLQELYKTKIDGFKMNSPMDRKSLEEEYEDEFTFKNEGIVLYVREIGTEKKAASKISEVLIPYAAAGMAEASDQDLKISYGESKTNTGGIVIENTSAYKYQVGVLTPTDAEFAKIGTAEEENIDISEMKWTSVKPGKLMKLANKKVPEGSYLIYRIAGENGNLPSTYEIYGPMKYDVLTYAGIATNKKTAGEELVAVVSTNLSVDDADLKFQWQVCADVKAAEPVWTDIAGATAKTYTLTNKEANQYVRVVITDAHENTVSSDYVGPVKANEKLDEGNKQ